VERATSTALTLFVFYDLTAKEVSPAAPAIIHAKIITHRIGASAAPLSGRLVASAKVAPIGDVTAKLAI